MIYPIILRILHIGAGVIWAGAAMLTAFFLEPAAHKLGPQGPGMLGALLGKARYTIVMMVTATLTLVSGILLYMRNTAGFSDMGWAATGTGVTLTVGAVAGIVAYTLGAAITGPTSAKLGQIAAEVQASDGPPSEEQAGMIKTLQGRLSKAGLIGAIFLAVCVLTMSIAQYL